MTSTLAVLGACAALGGLALPAGAQSAQPSRHFAPAATAVDCKRPRDTQILASDAADQTTSEGWVSLTDGLIGFTTTRIGCVIVTLSGTAAANNEIMFVRAELDGTTICAPSNINNQIFVADEDTGTAHAMTWLCANVAVGKHSIQVQYESYFGDPVTFSGHTLTVEHN
jgi:hypothetical protein